MQTSDQDLFERIAALGKVGVDQLVAYLGANITEDEADAEVKDDRPVDDFGFPYLSS